MYVATYSECPIFSWQLGPGLKKRHNLASRVEVIWLDTHQLSYGSEIVVWPFLRHQSTVCSVHISWLTVYRKNRIWRTSAKRRVPLVTARAHGVYICSVFRGRGDDTAADRPYRRTKSKKHSNQSWWRQHCWKVVIFLFKIQSDHVSYVWKSWTGAVLTISCFSCWSRFNIFVAPILLSVCFTLLKLWLFKKYLFIAGPHCQTVSIMVPYFPS